jgi:hypothetical protein
MCEFYISDSQFDRLDSDAPDQQLIIEALQDVIANLDSEGVWAYKGNYSLHFWCDDEKPKTIFCNAFVLLNPDDENDSSTESYCYYFEIKKAA